MILLDTSVLMAAYGRQPRGRGSATASALRRMIESEMSVGIPAVVLQEVLSRVRDTAQFHELQAHLTAFRILTATTEDHIRAAQLAAECAVKQIQCSTAVAIIVAQAEQDRWMLYTLSAEVAAVADLAGVALVHARHKV